MPPVLKRNAVIVLALAALFRWSFMFAKHDPALRNTVPFGDDPYDAIGSFGVIAGILIAMLSLFRAFRPYRKAPSSLQQIYLIRSQEAVVLASFITLAADAVAMARHPAIWIGTASRDRLIALLGGMALFTAFVQLLIGRSQEQSLGSGAKGWKAIPAASLSVVLVLAVYPEQLIRNTAAHLLTVLAGGIVLFAPMRALLNVLVPYSLDEGRTVKTPTHGGYWSACLRWGTVVFLGALIGAFAFAGEISEGGGAPPPGRFAFVASVFVGLGLAGLAIAYAFLA